MSDAFASAAATTAPFEPRLARFPGRVAEVGHGRVVAYREAGRVDNEAVPLVLLHGIGSGAASWLQQFEAFGAARRVLAWDAPGYGASTPLVPAEPAAADYARVLGAWLDVLGIARCVLVGHSLGAIVAGAFAAVAPDRLADLLLISPAAGYGAAPEAVRVAKRDARLAMLAELGPAGLAAQRSANMLSPHASEAARAWVRWNMARVLPHGYAQATHLLAHADLAADLARYPGRANVAVGGADTITPPAACERLAEAVRAPLQIVPEAGHAGYIEAPDAYNTLIDACCRAGDEPRSF